MESSRKAAPRGRRSRRLTLWAALSVGGLFGAVGCQVEYAGMTLPSSKYMHDDVQYFAPGPSFPWANTQAATQRSRMQAMGLDVPTSLPTGPLSAPERPAGSLAPAQNIPNMPTNINTQQRPLGEPAINVPPAPTPPGPSPTPPPPGVLPLNGEPAPGTDIPAPGGLAPPGL